MFQERKILSLFFSLFLAILYVIIYIPVKNVPGNTFRFQISLFTFGDWILLLTLSFLTSLSLVMNIFVIRNNLKSFRGLTTVGQGSFGIFSGLIGSLFGTASCASCVGSVLGFLGVGGILFLLKFRQIIVASSILIMIVTLYFTSKKVLGICKIKPK